MLSKTLDLTYLNRPSWISFLYTGAHFIMVGIQKLNGSLTTTLVGWNRSLPKSKSFGPDKIFKNSSIWSIYNTIKPINNSPPSGLGRYILLNFDRVKDRKCLTYYLTLRDRAIGSVMNFSFRLGAIGWPRFPGRSRNQIFQLY